MARVTVDESPVTVLPPASSTVTLGWVPKAVPPVEFDGLGVKASWAAEPTVTVKLCVLELVADPFTVPLALIVTLPARLPVTTSVATPLLVELGVAKLTEPGGVLVCEKLRASVESGPEVMGLPAASSIVAVKVRVGPRRGRPSSRSLRSGWPCPPRC